MTKQAEPHMKRSRAPKMVALFVRIRLTVDRRFRKHIGDGRILAKAVEQALVNEMKRGTQA